MCFTQLRPSSIMNNFSQSLINNELFTFGSKCISLRTEFVVVQLILVDYCVLDHEVGGRRLMGDSLVCGSAK